MNPDTKNQNTLNNDSLDDEKVEKKRRQAVKKIAATTGMVATMSGEWTKPILSSAILPAHAVGTDGEDCITDGACDS